MLIPSIDLMGGKVVQLVQGARMALEFDNFEYWIERFLPYPMVQLIDLDAAMGRGENRRLVEYFADRLPCQVGGGIRSVEAVQQMFRSGAKKVIVGSALLKNGSVDLRIAKEMAHAAAAERLIFAVDSREGYVAIKGWREGTRLTPDQMMCETEPYCGGFLYTHIDTEGTMTGIPIDVVRRLKQSTRRKLIAAGGIRSMDDVNELDSIAVDAVVGMALYTGKLGEPHP
ncbi:MAG TPA: HisA/HisF-related TIM barrel protein [Clostridia bacterium]|nr:HisA/HisF-related TIM barrel protein [Clostridia bacterium]